MFTKTSKINIERHEWNKKEQALKDQLFALRKEKSISEQEQTNAILEKIASESTCEHKIISGNELAKNYDLYKDYAVKYGFQEDVVETQIVKVNNVATPRVFTLRKHFFIVGKNVSHAIEDMRKQIEIGVDNFPKFDILSKEVEDLKVEQSKVEQDKVNMVKELNDSKDFLAYLASIIGQNAYDSYEGTFKRLQMDKASKPK